MKTFETASFHIVKPCNMRCKFCYATFEDMLINEQMSKDDACMVVFKLFKSGLNKITFAGGEPLLYRHIKDVIKYSKAIGLTTSIITNGYLLTEEWLAEMKSDLDWIGLSVDSLIPETQRLIGRISKKPINYYDLVDNIKLFGYKLKINTVVNSYNKDEDLNPFISWANPERWKVFQALRVEGQNDKQFEEIKVSADEFHSFVWAHKQQKSMVTEDNELMTGSYLLIDPQGRLFENSKGKHTYSSPLQNNSIEKCLSEINLDRNMFLKRGGIYEW